MTYGTGPRSDSLWLPDAVVTHARTPGAGPGRPAGSTCTRPRQAAPDHHHGHRRTTEPAAGRAATTSPNVHPDHPARGDRVTALTSPPLSTSPTVLLVDDSPFADEARAALRAGGSAVMRAASRRAPHRDLLPAAPRRRRRGRPGRRDRRLRAAAPAAVRVPAGQAVPVLLLTERRRPTSSPACASAPTTAWPPAVSGRARRPRQRQDRPPAGPRLPASAATCAPACSSEDDAARRGRPRAGARPARSAAPAASGSSGSRSCPALRGAVRRSGAADPDRDQLTDLLARRPGAAGAGSACDRAGAAAGAAAGDARRGCRAAAGVLARRSPRPASPSATASRPGHPDHRLGRLRRRPRAASSCYDRAQTALGAAAGHLDLLPVRWSPDLDRQVTDGSAPAPAGVRAAALLRRLKLPAQILATFVLGIGVPLRGVRRPRGGRLDVTGLGYWCVLAALLLTGARDLGRGLPGPGPAAAAGRARRRRTPTATAVIAAYLPNEAATILETVEAFHARRLPRRPADHRRLQHPAPDGRRGRAPGDRARRTRGSCRSRWRAAPRRRRTSTPP